MFRHLLVPLDGSTLAEAALPAAGHLAKTLGAGVTLLHMIERHAPHAVHGQPHLATTENAEQYLERLVKQTHSLGDRVQCHVHASKIDDVAGSIVAHADELQIDLIILCAHGTGGIRHGLFGTVAQRVIAHGATPVLLVPTPPRGAGSFSCQRLLVPLDGNPSHEQGLAAVTQLLPETDARVLLLMVIPTWRDLKQTQLIASRTLPATMVEMLDASSEPAQLYLDSKVAGVKHAGWQVTSRVVRGKPVAAIVTASRDFEADLIVLGTHGTGQLDAFWSESVTPELAHKAQLPLLLVPVHDESIAREINVAD